MRRGRGGTLAHRCAHGSLTMSGKAGRVASAILGSILGVLVGAGIARAQEALQVGAHLTAARLGELDTTDVGVGARAAWRPWRGVGIEGELNFYPRNIPDATALSANRVEGLFGVTAGPRLGPWRPFARVRPGFLRVGAAPQPVACILIYPPPLSCTLAGGDTLPALDLGGGVELFTPGRTFARVDVGDRMLRYPGPAFARDRQVETGNFTRHDFRLAVGAGWKF